MNQKQKGRIFSLIFVGVMMFSSAPFFSSSNTVLAQSTPSTATASERGVMNGFIPCGKSGDRNQDPSAEPCTACHAVLAGKNLLDYLTGIMVVVAVAVIVAMGVLYIVSGVNPNLKKTAKSGLTAVLTGLILMLSAWLIVSTILKYTANDNFIKGGAGFIGLMPGDGAYGLKCNTSSSGGLGKLTPGNIIANPGGGSGAGNGTCQVLSSGACSVDALQNTCFGEQAGRISQMCNVESSGGNPSSKSGVDVCGNYENRSFSGGLFQINVFANGAQISPECANLGSKGTCAQRRGDVCVSWTCTINDKTKFDSCMQKTFTASVNIAAACKLSNNGANLTPWACTANKCGLGGVTSSNPAVQNMCK